MKTTYKKKDEQVKFNVGDIVTLITPTHDGRVGSVDKCDFKVTKVNRCSINLENDAMTVTQYRVGKERSTIVLGQLPKGETWIGMPEWKDIPVVA